jgi:excisionase family DNA binding protein
MPETRSSGLVAQSASGHLLLDLLEHSSVLDVLADRVAERIADRLGTSEVDAWLTTTGAASYLAMHPDTLRKLASAGLIPYEQDRPGCRMFFRRSALDLWRKGGGAATST